MNYVLALLLIISSFLAFGQLQIMATRVSPADYTANGYVIPQAFPWKTEISSLRARAKTCISPQT